MTVLTQQNKLYAAERRALRGRDLTLVEARGLVNKLRDLPWWEENVPGVLDVEVRAVASGRSCAAWHAPEGAGVIEMRAHDLYERMVCHEIAHVLAEALWGSTSHCPMYARLYLTTVYLAMGPEAYKELYDAFVEDGIDFA